MNITRHEYDMAIVALAICGAILAYAIGTTGYQWANAGPIKVATSDASR